MTPAPRLRGRERARSRAVAATRPDPGRRAAEVTESEKNFVREFTAMLVAGLVVMLRVEDADDADGCVAVNLTLQERNRQPVVAWEVISAEKRGHVSLGEIASVNAEPRVSDLGYDLAARSFAVAPRNGPDLLFHTENKDICALVVDGLQMLVKDHRRRLGSRASRKQKKKPVSYAAKPLGEATNISSSKVEA